MFTKQSKSLFPTIAAFLAVLMYGCAPDVHRNYSGSVLPMNQIAVLVVSSGIIVDNIDQRKIPYATSGIFARKIDYIELLPGLHSITVRHISQNSKWDSLNDIQLSLNALPGHIYVFRYTIEKHIWHVWIVDVTEDYKDYVMKKLNKK